MTAPGPDPTAPPTAEERAGPYLRLPWPLVAGVLLAVLALALGVGLYANRNLRPGAAGPLTTTPVATTRATADRETSNAAAANPVAVATRAPGGATPAAPGKEVPPAPGRESPSSPRTEAPAGPGTGAPAGPGTGAPAGPGTEAPGRSGNNAPTGPGNEAPAGLGNEAPAAAVRTPTPVPPALAALTSAAATSAPTPPVMVLATATAAAAVPPPSSPVATPVPTVDPALAAELDAAYQHYWDVLADALFDLDSTHLSEVMAEQQLESVEKLIGDLRVEGHAIRTEVDHQYAVVKASTDDALIIDRYTDTSVYVETQTHDQIGAAVNDVIEDQFRLRQIDGTWRVVSIVRTS